MTNRIVFWGDSIAQGGFNAFGGIDNAEEGKTLAQVRAAHPVSAIPQGAAVIINVGTNDAVNIATGSNSTAAAQARAREIIDTAAEMRAAGHPVIVTSLPIALDRFRFRGGTQAQTDAFQNISQIMNAEMARYAQERGVTFRSVPALPDPSGDGLHLSGAGYRSMYAGPVSASRYSAAPAPVEQAAAGEDAAPAESAEAPATFTKDDVREILSRPITMDTMRELQQGLGIEVDGKFGPQTLAALRNFMGDENLGDMSASNWALIARGARDAEGVAWIRAQIGDDAALRQAVAGNIAPRMSAEAGTLAANQYQSSLSVLGYLDGAKIGTIDQATYDALGRAHTDFESIVPEFTPPAADETSEDTAEADAEGAETPEEDADAEDAEASAEGADAEGTEETADAEVTDVALVTGASSYASTLDGEAPIVLVAAGDAFGPSARGDIRVASADAPALKTAAPARTFEIA